MSVYLTWKSPNSLVICLPTPAELAQEPVPRCWRACWLCALQVGLGRTLALCLIQAAFPHSGYHRLKEGAVPTIFETFSKLRRTGKTKGHRYSPGLPDVSRLRRCRKRYVLQVRVCVCVCVCARTPHSYPKTEGVGFRVFASSLAGQVSGRVEQVQVGWWSQAGPLWQSPSLPPAALRAEDPQLHFLHLHLLMSPAFLRKRPQHLPLCLPPPLGGWSLASAAPSQTSWGPWVPRQMKQAAVPSPPLSGSRPLLSHGPMVLRKECLAVSLVSTHRPVP